MAFYSPSLLAMCLACVTFRTLLRSYRLVEAAVCVALPESMPTGPTTVEFYAFNAHGARKLPKLLHSSDISQQ
jgi:hypothetical protein